MHAGHVVQAPRERINAFYAQSWAFARFLNEAEGGRYRPMFRKLLADAAAGVVEPSQRLGRARVELLALPHAPVEVEDEAAERGQHYSAVRLKSAIASA